MIFLSLCLQIHSTRCHERGQILDDSAYSLRNTGQGISFASYVQTLDIKSSLEAFREVANFAIHHCFIPISNDMRQITFND